MKNLQIETTNAHESVGTKSKRPVAREIQTSTGGRYVVTNLENVRLTDSRIEPRCGACLMIDEVDLSFGGARLLPSVRQRTQRVGRAAGGFPVVDRSGDGRNVRRGRRFPRVLPCRGSRQVAGK